MNVLHFTARSAQLSTSGGGINKEGHLGCCVLKDALLLDAVLEVEPHSFL